MLEKKKFTFFLCTLFFLRAFGVVTWELCKLSSDYFVFSTDRFDLLFIFVDGLNYVLVLASVCLILKLFVFMHISSV